jgi:hypothetical protein
MRRGPVRPLITVLAIAAVGFGLWVAAVGFGADSGSGSQFAGAVALGAALWVAAAALIVGLWLFGVSPSLWAWIPFALWFPSFILVVSLVYDTPTAPAPTTVASPPSATLPGTTTAPANTVSPAPPPPATVPATTVELTPGSLCSEPGIRYAGSTAEGGEVCFTLTVDRLYLVEIGWEFVRASGCPERAIGTSYIGPPAIPLNDPGRIDFGGLTATMDGPNARGTLDDSAMCGTKTFKWSAREVPR